MVIRNYTHNIETRAFELSFNADFVKILTDSSQEEGNKVQII